ncbi:MAG: ABC transporter permease subunit [Rhodospirillales bacterium]|nr:ABC transporter permease subunit [Rhodospirillales bacterium]
MSKVQQGLPTLEAGRGAGAVAWLKAHPNIVRAASVIVFFGYWEWAARDMSPLFMTYPSAIFRAAWAITANGELPQAFLASLWPFAIGLFISIVGGIALGVLIAQFWFLEYVLDPFLNALYAIPRVALVPLIILWAGLETTGKVTILVSIAIFPVIINTYAGIKDVRGGLLEIGKAYGATESQIFFKIILPASVPYIMAGVRLAVGLAIIGMVVAEFFTAITGLGGLIVNYSNSFATAKLFVPIIVIGLLGVALTEFVMWIERRLSRWRALERERF